jgi:hypothetical protein
VFRQTFGVHWHVHVVLSRTLSNGVACMWIPACTASMPTAGKQHKLFAHGRVLIQQQAGSAAERNMHSWARTISSLDSTSPCVGCASTCACCCSSGRGSAASNAAEECEVQQNGNTSSGMSSFASWGAKNSSSASYTWRRPCLNNARQPLHGPDCT